MAKDVERLTIALADAKDQCSKLAKQLEDDQLSHGKEIGAKEVTESELRAESEKLKTFIANLEKERDELVTQLDESKQEDAARSVMALGLQSKQDESTKKLSELTRLIKSASAENTSLSNENDALSTENTALLQQVESLSSKARNVQHELDTVRKEQDRINKDLTVKLGEISKQKDILSEQLHSKIKELERSHAAAVTSLEGENNDLNDQKQEMTQRIATLETESSLLTAELNDAKKSAIQEQEQLSGRVTSLVADLLEARQCTAAKEAESNSRQNNLEAVQKSLAEITIKRDELLVENDSMQKEIATLTDNISEATSKLDGMTKQKESLVESINSFVRELAMVNDGRPPSAKLRDAHAVASTTDDGLDSQVMRMIVELKADFRSLQSQKADLLKTSKDKTARVNELESKVSEMIQRIEKLSTEVELKNEQLNDAKNEAIVEHGRLNSIISCLETNLLQSKDEEERLGKALKSLEDDHTENQALWDFQKKDFQARFDTLAQTSEEEIRILSEDLKAASTTLSDCKALISTKQTKIKSLEAEKVVLEESIQTMANKCDQLTSSLAFAKTMVNDLSLENDKYMQQEKTSQSEISCLENIITSLKREYEVYKEESRAALRSCEAKIESTAKGLEAAQDESAILEQQVRILSTEVSKYKIQKKGMLRALDEITNVTQNCEKLSGDDTPIDEIAIDREVTKRLILFRDKVVHSGN